MLALGLFVEVKQAEWQSKPKHTWAYYVAASFSCFSHQLGRLTFQWTNTDEKWHQVSVAGWKTKTEKFLIGCGYIFKFKLF